jgi:hypothetical protein
MCVVLEDKIRGDTILKEIKKKVFSSEDGTLEMRGILPLYIYKKRNDGRSRES